MLIVDRSPSAWPRVIVSRFTRFGALATRLTRFRGVSWSICALLMVQTLSGAEEMTPERARNTVILDPVSIQNLRIETQTADDQTFEQVIFAGGRVEPIPTARAVVASDKAGRVAELKVSPGDMIKAGAEVVRIQPEGSTADAPGEMLTSPIAGMVTAVHVVIGETFRRVKTLVEITDLREVDVVGRVPEHEASMLQVDSTARILVPAACDKILRGKLARFGTEGDRKHGTVEAYYRLPNRDLLMRPGMRAELRIAAAIRKTSAVPREAVQGSAAERFVFIKHFELPNAFVRVPVVTGQRNDRFVEIVSGLMPGDEVVTNGAYALSSAGTGSVSLKAALDAAHGHEHSDDGKPLQEGEASGENHEHEEHGAEGPHARHITPATIFFATLSALLLGLLYLSRRYPPQTAT